MNDANYAGFGIRFVARIIDLLILLALLVMLALFLGVVLYLTADSMPDQDFYHFASVTAGLGVLLGIFIRFGYFIAFHAKSGQTIGKKIMKIRVVKTDGNKLGWSLAIIREIGEVIAAFPLWIGYLWIVIDKNKQGWHDKIANTYVVKVKK